MGYVTWPHPFQGRFVICSWDLLCSTHILSLKCLRLCPTCNEEMKGNAKCKNFRFEPPFGGLRGNVHVVDFLLAIIAVVASSHGCGTIKRNLSKSAFSERVRHFERKF